MDISSFWWVWATTGTGCFQFLVNLRDGWIGRLYMFFTLLLSLIDDWIGRFGFFVEFMQLSTNAIAGCELVSPGPPHLKHICGPKSLPVSYFFYVRKTCHFYEIYDTFNKPYSRMRFGFPRASSFEANVGSQIAPCLLLLSRSQNLQLLWDLCNFQQTL